MLAGDLSDLTSRLDSYRYEVTGKLLRPVYWSRDAGGRSAEVPTDGREHELSLFMQDTGWPDAPLDDYIELWDHDYWQHMRQTPARQEAPRHPGLLSGGPRLGHPPEAILMQKIMNFSILGGLLTSQARSTTTPTPGRAPT